MDFFNFSKQDIQQKPLADDPKVEILPTTVQIGEQIYKIVIE